MTRAPRCPTPLAALGLLAAAPAGCSDDAAYIVVTVETRPAVRDPAALRVTLSNAGSMRTEDLALRDATFPATFSISPEGRTGEFGIAISASVANSAPNRKYGRRRPSPLQVRSEK